MSIPTNTFDSYAAKGLREDLTDKIYTISPTETPFQSMIGKGAKAKAVFHEWQTDALAAAVGTNYQIEGDDITADASTATTRLGNYTQISRKSAAIPGSLEAVDKAGRAKEMGYQVAKHMQELKRDMETTLVGTNQARSAGTTGATPRKLASVLSWIKTNTDKGTGSAADPSAADGTGTRTDGTQRAFTETILKNTLKLCADAGGDPDTVMVGTFNKQVASTFSGGATKFDQTEDKKLVAAVDYYVSDFGKVKIVFNRFQRARDALVLDSAYWGLAFLRPVHTFDLAKTGDTEKKAILVEYTLESRNEAASAIAADLTTS